MKGPRLQYELKPQKTRQGNWWWTILITDGQHFVEVWLCTHPLKDHGPHLHGLTLGHLDGRLVRTGPRSLGYG